MSFFVCCLFVDDPKFFFLWKGAFISFLGCEMLAFVFLQQKLTPSNKEMLIVHSCSILTNCAPCFVDFLS